MENTKPPMYKISKYNSKITEDVDGLYGKYERGIDTLRAGLMLTLSIANLEDYADIDENEKRVLLPAIILKKHKEDENTGAFPLYDVGVFTRWGDGTPSGMLIFKEMCVWRYFHNKDGDAEGGKPHKSFLQGFVRDYKENPLSPVTYGYSLKLKDLFFIQKNKEYSFGSEISKGKIMGLKENTVENKMKNSIKEGGNVTVTLDGKEYGATKIPIKRIGRKKFTEEFSKLFLKINRMFKKKYDKWLWDEDVFFNKGLIDPNLFNGSTSYMMDLEIPDNTVIDLKPDMGDIDLIVDETMADDIKDFLKNLKGKRVTEEIKFISSKNSASAVITLWEYKPDYMKDLYHYVQVDFELSEFENVGGEIKPTEFARFGHSSSIKDLQAGIKAVFHKFLLSSVSRAMSQKPNVVLCTKTANAENWEKKIAKKQTDSMIKFSVDRGVRMAYEQLFQADGSPVTDKKGHFVFKLLDTKDSVYNKSVTGFFELFFNKKPTKAEEKDFWTFVGVVGLIRTFTSVKQQEMIIKRFFELLWDSKDGRNLAQELEKNNPELDFKIKDGAYSYLEDNFSIAKKIRKANQDGIERYYKQYARGDKESLLKQAISKAQTRIK